MSTELAKTATSEAIEQALVQGNLASLTPAQRAAYYRNVCESLGLNPLTKPFEYITLNGKLTLYARKDCTDQLRTIKGISIDKPDITFQDEWILVAVQARDGSGRTDSDIGVVSRKDMRGDFGNAVMKAVTKAKRRVTLSMCGLGMMDETEVESIPGARVVSTEDAHSGEVVVSDPRHIPGVKSGASLRDIDAELTACPTLADLGKVWTTLSPAEQKKHLAAKDARKAALTVKSTEGEQRSDPTQATTRTTAQVAAASIASAPAKNVASQDAEKVVSGEKAISAELPPLTRKGPNPNQLAELADAVAQRTGEPVGLLIGLVCEAVGVPLLDDMTMPEMVRADAWLRKRAEPSETVATF